LAVGLFYVKYIPIYIETSQPDLSHPGGEILMENVKAHNCGQRPVCMGFFILPTNSKLYQIRPLPRFLL